MRFILIDHSITDLAGHHYEYAMHVLRAAERSGFEPILVTNRKFRETEAVPWKVLPIYEFGFWPEPAAAPHVQFAVSRVQQLRAAWFRWRCRMRYSPVGLAWLCRFRWNLYLQRRPSHLQALPAWILGISFIAALKLMRTVAMVILLPVALVGLLLWVVWGLLRYLATLPGRVAAGAKRAALPPLASRYLRALRNEAKTYQEFSRLLGGILTSAIRARRQAATDAQERHQSQAFSRDTETLLSKLQPTTSDVFFIPTIATRDMLGLTEVLARRPAAAQASWHLLFRRNLYSGTRAQYAQQDPSLDNVRQAFQAVQQRLKLHARLFFYTDTDELTYQYDRLGVFPFHTLPVPHTYSPEERHPHAGPLRITYLGDARREKGFSLLPALAVDLQDGYLRSGQAHFVVQCNYNIPGGEPEASVARCQLESLPRDYITLYKNPLTSKEYKALLLAADINLLLYDPVNYYARSSGILVESLAAGIPVMVPARNWLARQFLEPFSARQEKLRDEFNLLRSVPHTAVTWRRHGNPAEPVLIAGELRPQFDERAACWIEVPYGSTHLLVTLEWSQDPCTALLHSTQIGWAQEELEDGRITYLEGTAVSRRSARAIPLLPGIYKLWLALGAAYPRQEIRVRSMRLDFLRAPQGVTVPMGAVGMIYDSEDQIPGCLSNMIDHYSYFRETALAFAKDWCGYHNADRLVADLRTAAGVAPAPSEVTQSATVG